MAAAQPHQHHGVVLISVQTVGKRRMQWKVKDRAARQRAGESTDRKSLVLSMPTSLQFRFSTPCKMRRINCLLFDPSIVW